MSTPPSGSGRVPRAQTSVGPMTRRRFVGLVGLAGAGILGTACGDDDAPARTAGPADRPDDDAVAGREVDVDVVVVGAGLAGLAAARDLAGDGYDVVVVEARDRIGGRVHSVEVGDGVIDLGASWIHGPSPDNPMVGLRDAAGARTIATPWDDQCLVARGVEVDDEIAEWAEELLAELEDRKGDVGNRSMAELVDEVLADAGLDSDDERALRWIVWSSIALEYASDLEDLSAEHWDEDDAFGEGDDLIVGGTRLLLAPLADALDIRLGTVVRAIRHDEAGVVVETVDGPITAEAAIVTLPVGVLAAGTVDFAPPLPTGHRDAIERIGVGTMRKVGLVYDEVWWDPDCPITGAVDHRWELFDVTTVAGAPALLALTAGTDAHGADPVGSARAAIAAAYGADPEPAETTVSSWHDDPYALGSYTHIAPGGSFADLEVLAEPAGPRLFLAGEGTHARYPATMHGAYLSGRRAAEQVMDRT